MSAIIDTHCHLNFSAFKDDLEEVVARMRHDSVQGIVVGSQLSTSQRAIDIAHTYSDLLYAAVALHPLHLFERFVDEVEIPFRTRAEVFSASTYERFARDEKVVAIGECGLDYYTIPEGIAEAAYKKTQKDIFEEHIAIATKLQLPLIVHTRAHPSNYRDAYDDIYDILNHHDHPRAVMHAFATFPKLAKQFLEAGHMISFTGLVTYPEFPVLREVVQYVPLERMMIETDSPYMTPQEIRIERNEPVNVIKVAQFIAEVKNKNIEEVIASTTENAKEFFKI